MVGEVGFEPTASSLSEKYSYLAELHAHVLHMLLVQLDPPLLFFGRSYTKLIER
jgi:hypothetical protein